MTHAYIAELARGWTGTRFHHQGRLKKTATHKGGVDCLGLLVGVAQEAGFTDAAGRLLAQYDETNYGHIPNGRRLKSKLDALLVPVEQKDMQVGDVLLMEFEGNPQHLAIVDAYEKGGFALIHAYAAVRGVVRHRMDEEWRRRIIAAYRVRL